MSIEYREVGRISYESARTTYWFICEDLKEGLEYGFDAKLYNRCMKAIGSDKRAKGDITSRQFAEDFYQEHKRLREENKL